MLEALAERFWSKVSKGRGCWLWQASLTTTGYGQFSMGGRKGHPWKAHHVAWFLTHGRKPKYLDHLCHEPKCVNPSHLEKVTHRENMRRASERKTHCIHGHDYTKYGKVRKSGHRYCVACWGGKEND